MLWWGTRQCGSVAECEMGSVVVFSEIWQCGSFIYSSLGHNSVGGVLLLETG